MYWGEAKAYANSFLLFLLLLTYNLLSGNALGFWENAARSFFLSSVILICIVLLLGPLSRFFPERFRHDLLYRKPFGIAGTSFAWLYFLVVALATYRLDFLSMFSSGNGDFLPWVFWFISLLILSFLALASLPYYMQKLGFGHWKNMQVLGYSALVLMMLHLMLVSNGYFLKTNSGKTIFMLLLITLLLKAIVTLLGVHKRHSRHEVAVLMREQP